MTTGLHKEMARILTFPKRSGTASRSVEWRGQNIVDLAPHRLPPVDHGEAWYHDDAIKEERKLQR